MMSRWRFGWGPREQAGTGPDGGGSAVEPREAARAAPMQMLGERNELLHVRFSYMVDRLEDLRSLPDDFKLLTGPIEEIARELPAAKARIIEVEALLSRELTRTRELSAELRDAVARGSALSDENLGISNRLKSQQELVDRLESVTASDRQKLAELATRLNAAERSVVAETENRQRLDAEIAVLSSDLAQTAEELRHAREVEIELSQRNAELEQETLRQQDVIEAQVVALVEMEARANEVEKIGQARQQEIVVLSRRLESERSERQQSDYRHDIARAALQADNSSLGLRIEAMGARLASAEQSLIQSREQTAEKDAALRGMQAALRGNEKDLAAAKRQVAQLTASESTLGARLEESQSANEELSKRCDMLTKALSAKDAALENLAQKARARSERADELATKFDQERRILEESQRRLVEELENERAERTLAQGALKIARESRASLQRLNESLKRANREMHSASQEEAEPAEASAARDAAASKANVVSLPPRESIQAE